MTIQRAGGHSRAVHSSHQCSRHYGPKQHPVTNPRDNKDPYYSKVAQQALKVETNAPPTVRENKPVASAGPVNPRVQAVTGRITQ